MDFFSLPNFIADIALIALKVLLNKLITYLINKWPRAK